MIDKSIALPKTIEQIEADPFLKQCVTVVQEGEEFVIKMHMMSEVRIPNELIAYAPKGDRTAESLADSVMERFAADMSIDVYPTMVARIKQFRGE